MPTVQDILASKGSFVHSIMPGTCVMDAVQYMNLHKIGSLVVMDEGQVQGLFTERDVLTRIVGQSRDPNNTIVSEVMTVNVVCVGPHTDIDEVSEIMRSRRIRHVPVCDPDGKLLGMVSMGDLNAHHADSQEATISYLNEYIYGRV